MNKISAKLLNRHKLTIADNSAVILQNANTAFGSIFIIFGFLLVLIIQTFINIRINGGL